MDMKEMAPYRESVCDIAKRTGRMPEALLVPKNGALAEYTDDILFQSGMNMKDPWLSLAGYRGEDIPKIVEQSFLGGEFMLGITGDDLFDEYILRNPNSLLTLLNTYDWYDPKAMFNRPALCLIGKQGTEIPEKPKVAVNAKYEMTSRKYLDEEFRDYEAEVYAGDTEKTVAKGINDCCVEIVYSGKTADKLNLRIIRPYRFSDLVLISPLYGAGLLAEVLRREYEVIQDREENPKKGSKTSDEFAEPEMITRKLNEECYEVIQALGGKGRLVPEIADLTFRMMQAMALGNATLEELALEVMSRQK